MRFLPAVGLVASASAFLIIPDAGVDTESLPDGVRQSWTQTLDLDCPKCPVRMPHSGEITTEMESHLQMKFEIDLEQGKRFFLNGFEIYPRANPFTKPLTAPHIVDVPEGSWDRKGMMRGGMMHSGSSDMMNSVDTLGFTMSAKAQAGTEDDFEHILIDLQIIEVSDVFVDNIPSVHVELVRDDAGIIAIANIESGDTENPSTTTDAGEAGSKCDSWLCEWIDYLEKNWNHWRPHCGMGTKNRPEKGGHHGPGHHKGPHHGHHGHHSEQSEDPEQPEQSPMSYSDKERTWGQLMWSITTHTLLPVLIGIAASILASLIGIAASMLLIYVYPMVFRSCPRRRAIPKVVAVHEEKGALMEHQEPPPLYEETPVEDAENKV